MPNPIEALQSAYHAVDQRIPRPPRYLVHLAERTFGIDAYKNLRRSLVSDPKNITPPSLAVDSASSIAHLIFPAMVDAVSKVQKRKDAFSVVVGGMGAGLMDYGFYNAMSQGLVAIHSPVEFAVYRLAANVVINVGSDLIDIGLKGVNRLNGFRPQAPATLAV